MTLTQVKKSVAGPNLTALSFRNKLINGNFDFWQRGDSQTSAGLGSDDRWQNDNYLSSKTHSKQAFTVGQTDVPGNPKYYSRTVVTSVSDPASYTLKTQKIESVRTLAGKTATVSFHAKADSNKDIAVKLGQYFGSGESSGHVQIGVKKHSLTTYWQKFENTFDVPSIADKTIGGNKDDCLSIVFWFDAGSNWDYNTNSLGNQSGTFDIAQVQVEEGEVATPFEDRPPGLEFDLCSRYAKIIGAGINGMWASTTLCVLSVPIYPPMRGYPSIFLLTTTPEIDKVGYGVKTGSNSTLVAQTPTSRGMCAVLVDGFSNVSFGNVASVRTRDLFLIDSEL
jgi:hypothetical protein